MLIQQTAKLGKVSVKFYTHNKTVQKIFLPLFFVTPQVATSHIVGSDLLEGGDLLLFPRLVLTHHVCHEGSNLGRCSDGLAGIDEEQTHAAGQHIVDRECHLLGHRPGHLGHRVAVLARQLLGQGRRDFDS